MGLQNIAVAELHPSPENPRKSVGDIGELAESITAVGIIEPLVVIPSDKGFEVICGGRRLAAARKAKLDEVPALVREDLSPADALEIMLVENIQRTDITPLEEAQSFLRLIEEFGHSQRDLGARVGRSQAHISKRLSLLSLPKPLQKEVEVGNLGIGDALEYARLAEQPERLKEAVALKSDDPFMTVKAAVDRTEAVAKRQDAMAQGWAEVEKKGLAKAPDDWRDQLMRGRMGRVGDNVKVRSHEKLECHVTGVDADGALVALCNDPQSHVRPAQDKSAAVSDAVKGAKLASVPNIADKAEAKEEARKAKAKEHQTALNAAKKLRDEFVTKLASERQPKTGLLELTVTTWARTAGTFVTQRANKYLGITQGKDQEFVTANELLVSYIGESPDNTGRAAIALVCATEEGRINGPGAYWTGDDTVAYFEMLETRGYEVSVAEKVEVSGHPSKG